MPTKKSPTKPLVTGGAVVNYRDSWRIFRIITEFVEGYQFLGQFKKEVTILGSARLPEKNKYYKIAEELGKLLGNNGFTVITGGGPSIMEAANKGAYDTAGESVGLNIQLPREQRVNRYVEKSIGFYYFFSRKVMLTSTAGAFVFFPGGFGTLDELFEVVDNIELGHTKKAPIVLVGREFWDPIVNFLIEKSAKETGSIGEANFDRWFVVETAQEAFDIIKDIEDKPDVCKTDSNHPDCKGGLDWRVFRIMAELVDGFEFLTKNPSDVTVFGTKSIPYDSVYYRTAYEVGKVLAKNNFSTVTGGGPGVMEAANKGAFEHGGASIGINMRFERGERVNSYVANSIGFFFPFVRKLIITAPAKEFVFFPGGFGTMHHLFEILTLIETKKIQPIPILLYGKEFWQPMLDIINGLYSKFGTIGESDKELVKVIEHADEVLLALKH
ncbi:MAG: TIGR00730 family Rossman fold protein [Parcubacteria group bacterium]|nr:TIGR00730 family Rossman fold protein [Parcubacteria group bacterium]